MSPIVGSLAGISTRAYGLFGVFSKAVVTGGTLYSDATYYYRVFTTTGTLTVNNAPLTADVLVVAGGGGGGCDNYPGSGTYQRYGSGGGAGGLRLILSQSLAVNTYAATIGAGGTGVANSAGAIGSNSSLIGGSVSISGSGGGGGGGHQSGPPYVLYATAGGSGGGGTNSGGTLTGQGNAGSYSPVEGYNGGYEYGGGGNNAAMGGGGGGGAGGNGGNAPSYPSGASLGGGPGGVGAGGASYANYAILNSIGAATSTGQLVSGNYYYAGGGGGTAGDTTTTGSGGYGGGGLGLTTGRAATNGTANTGGGGGGANGTGASGGSGLVIIRYTKASVGG